MSTQLAGLLGNGLLVNCLRAYLFLFGLIISFRRELSDKQLRHFSITHGWRTYNRGMHCTALIDNSDYI